MTTSAAIIADSIAPDGARLTTFQVTFPRFILAEVNTHRVLSRNYRSSRAVPVKKLCEEVRTNPFVPKAFTRNMAGMRGGDPLEGLAAEEARQKWERAAYEAGIYAELLADVGAHKQYANRLLEPFLYVHGVISATEWDNFFALRCHPDAQPEFRELAEMMRDLLESNEPTRRSHGRGVYPPNASWWHLPYITPEERDSHSLATLLKMSAARGAWVSYRPYDESDATDLQKVDRTLAKLLGTPMHASPFEHVATPGNCYRSNFRGWDQLRHILEEEPSYLGGV